MPIQARIGKFSLIIKLPKDAAMIGDKASIDNVFLVPINCNDFK